MARRTEYVSFFTEGRGRGRDFIGFERRAGLTRVLLPALGVAFIAVSIWWFGFRDADADVGSIVTMDDATVPTLILPAGAESGDLLGEATFDCPETSEEWSMFQGGPSRTGCLETRVITEPRILWKAEVGIQGWLNNAVIGGNTLFVSSAGVVQFVPDRRDAIYALDLRNNLNQLWYYQAELDVNGIGYLDGVVVATGDEGRVWALDARTGDVLWIEDFGELDPVYSNPLMINGMVIVGDALGNVVAFDVRDGDERWRAEVGGAIRGGAASDGELVFIAGENHEVLAVDMTGSERWRADVFARGQSAEETRVFAAPTVAGDLVIVSLVRTGVYAEPAVIALDKATGEIAWQARDVAGLKTGDWANVRSSVAVAGDVVLFGEALSDSLVALDLQTGQTRWSAKAGSYCIPHWPSPAITGGQAILPRDDGGVYAIDLTSREVVWSLYLGNETSQPGGTFPAAFDDGFCEEDESGYGILSSPAVTEDGVIIVGTLEGFIYAISDRNW
jgi:outer membrane protein assembly factor BamB